MLDRFALTEGDRVELPGSMYVLVFYLVNDGLIRPSPLGPQSLTFEFMGRKIVEEWTITPKGRELVNA